MTTDTTNNVADDLLGRLAKLRHVDPDVSVHILDRLAIAVPQALGRVLTQVEEERTVTVPQLLAVARHLWSPRPTCSTPMWAVSPWMTSTGPPERSAWTWPP